MTYENSFFCQKMNIEFQARLTKNAHYSVRAFSRDLRIPASTLSHILSGKRRLPKVDADRIADLVCENYDEKRLFIQSLQIKKTKIADISNQKFERAKTQLEEELHSNIISEWEYYATLSLLNTRQLIRTPKDVSLKLGISLKRAEYIIDGLLKLKFISISDSGEYVREVKPLKTSDGVRSHAIRNSHRQSLQLASEKLEVIPLNERHFSSTTLSVDKKNLAEARSIIKDFYNRITPFLSEGSPTEVYQMSIQLFPLSKTDVSLNYSQKSANQELENEI